MAKECMRTCPRIIEALDKATGNDGTNTLAWILSLPASLLESGDKEALLTLLENSYTCTGPVRIEVQGEPTKVICGLKPNL